jgi:hypothetical protein
MQSNFGPTGLCVVYLATLFRDSEYTASNEGVIRKRCIGSYVEEGGRGLI